MRNVLILVTVVLCLALMSAGLLPVEAQGSVAPPITPGPNMPITAPGFYDGTDPRVKYNGTWNTNALNYFGDSYRYADYNTSASAQFWTDATVGSVVIYYETGTLWGTLRLYINSCCSSPAASININSPPNSHGWYTLTIPTPGPNIIYIGGNNNPTTLFNFTGVSALPVAQVFPTAINVILPTHTPTPTLTPTLTSTPGPSPTPSATATTTAQPIISYEVNGQDVVYNATVTPGDVAMIAILVIITGLIMSALYFYVRGARE